MHSLVVPSPGWISRGSIFEFVGKLFLVGLSLGLGYLQSNKLLQCFSGRRVHCFSLWKIVCEAQEGFTVFLFENSTLALKVMDLACLSLDDLMSMSRVFGVIHAGICFGSSRG